MILITFLRLNASTHVQTPKQLIQFQNTKEKQLISQISYEKGDFASSCIDPLQ